MRLRAAFVVAVIASAAVSPAAIAGELTLHPSGFGEHSYSAWEGREGLHDRTGENFAALYFQKRTTTATFAAGVAVIRGLEGTPASQLTAATSGLAWDHRVDGHCGAGAPRWNVNLEDAAGQRYTVFLGCSAAVHAPLNAAGPSLQLWCTDRYPGPAIATAIKEQTGLDAADLALRNLAIVFDEGTDSPNAPPAGCAQTGLAGGFVYLDNVTVQMNGVAHVWTGPSDNAAGETIVVSEDPLTALLDDTLESLF